MASLPTATVRIDLTGGPTVVSTRLGCVIGPVLKGGDIEPFLAGNASQALARYGYCELVEYVTQHIQDTGLPIVVVPLPADAPGTLTAQAVTTTSTSDCTVSMPPEGIGINCRLQIKVVTGGTVETDEITIAYSLNGGEQWTNVRIGTLSAYTIPHTNAHVAFSVGALVEGEIVYDGIGTAPMYSASDFQVAVDALAASSHFVRNWLCIGTQPNSLAIQFIVDQATRYETQYERYITAKCYVQDHTAAGKELASGDWQALVGTAFSGIDGSHRIDIGAGMLRRASPIVGQILRFSVQFADNIRAFQHDIHIATWEKDFGPLPGWSIEDSNNNVVEHDERVWPGLLESRFTCARTWGNGPRGTYIATSLTRASEGSILGYTHNAAVANLFQTVCQSSTEMTIGRSLVLNTDGTASSKSLAAIRDKVEGDLARALIEPGLEGQRASSVSWEPSPGDKFDTVGAVMHGFGELNLRGTIARIETAVRVR